MGEAEASQRLKQLCCGEGEARSATITMTMTKTGSKAAGESAYGTVKGLRFGEGGSAERNEDDDENEDEEEDENEDENRQQSCW